jgi:NAD(P)-dependent dehydrogenase (short-subunit alcohol dehydrogenase family)
MSLIQAQIDAAIKAAEEKFGGIDVLVNNAGIGYFAAIEEGEDNRVRRMFEINVFGLSRMIQAVLPGMRKRRKGCIVNISSLAGLRSAPALGLLQRDQVCGRRFVRGAFAGG